MYYVDINTDATKIGETTEKKTTKNAIKAVRGRKGGGGRAEKILCFKALKFIQIFTIDRKFV